MKLDPGFLSHWKTELLIERLGAEGVLCVLRLWGNAQIRRRYSGLELTPKRLQMETKWKGDENHLWDALTDPEAPWLDKAEDGTWTIHGFAEQQKQVVHLWDAGRRGGRPSKKEIKEEPYSYSSSSSYPICKPNGNQMVSESVEKSKKDFISEQNESAEQIARRIMNLRPGWDRPAVLTYAEMDAIAGNMRVFNTFTNDDWTLIRRFLAAPLPQGAAYTQPRLRGKFIEWCAGVYADACRWNEKQHGSPRQASNIPGVK